MSLPLRTSEVREPKDRVGYLANRDDDPTSPNIEHLVIDDGKPVDNIYSEIQMRLLTEPLYSSWKPKRNFVAKADVGVFANTKEPPIVPDVLLAMDVIQGQDLRNKENLSYFVWIRGKVPDVVIEIVSQHAGGEDTKKLARYQQLKIPHYVIWDPLGTLRKDPFRYYQFGDHGLQRTELTGSFPDIGLGLTLWTGTYENHEETWLRWTDQAGDLILTGAERADLETSRATSEAERANIEADRADRAAKRATELAEFLRKQGFDPESL